MLFFSKNKQSIITIALMLCLYTNLQANEQNNIKPVTVFVHGTLFHSWLSWIVHELDCPLGLNLAIKHGNKYVMGKIPYILSQAAPEKYPLETFYMFGWSGELSFEERQESAHDLYHELKKIKGPITIIGHSHGGNVSLNLAQIAQDHNDKEFIIDELILLACPVQQVNAHLVKSKIFKKVFSLFSSVDWEQVGDPQGLYEETKKLNRPVNLFSERTFTPCENLMQAQIFLSGQSPRHQDFIFQPLLKRMTEIINLLEKTNSNKEICFVNVPFNQPPHFAPKKEVKFFTPRRRMQKVS